MTDLDAATERLYGLTDDELAAFVRNLDQALEPIRTCPNGLEAQNAITLAACARIMLRQRHQDRARAAASALVDSLMRGAGGA